MGETLDHRPLAGGVDAHREAELQSVGIPYSPRETTASDVQPSGPVPVRMLTTESTAAFAADAAEERPRASMIAAPRFWTVVRKSPCSHSSSRMTSGTEVPSMVAWATSGNWVAE